MKKNSIFILCLLAVVIYGNAQINYQLYNDLPKGPVGGGPGYEATVFYDNSFTLVHSLAELKAALSNSNIHKIFIPGDLSFNIAEPLEIKTDGLILASDRGQFDRQGRVSPGARLLLQNASYNGNDLLVSVRANNVRVSGLRFTSEDVEKRSVGIQIRPINGIDIVQLEVDNCELFNWGYAAIRIDGPLSEEDYLTRGTVHHNHIHDNTKDGLGYGTVINYRNAHGQMLYNLYDNNRHSVAGYGMPNEKYTAAYNLTIKNVISSEYDMHGFSDYSKKNCQALSVCDPYDPCNHAGTEIILLNNALMNSNAEYFFGIRGIPIQGAFVTRNFYKAPLFYKLWRTWSFKDSIGPCEMPAPKNENIDLSQDQWSAYNLSVWDNNLNPNGRYVQYISWSGKENWQPLFFNAYEKGKIAFGDFNGDQISDIFYGDGTSWKVSWNGVTPWENLSNSGYQIDDLAFGDFNGDGKTDVFLANGVQWKVSRSGTSSWDPINNSGYKTDQLAFGDFNNDGKTDVFLANGVNWKISWSGTSTWDTINTSGYKTDQLAFGDFNNDGKTDVFLANGVEWKVSLGGASIWEPINTSGYKTDQLAFGDFNGDGETDVFLANGVEWKVSWGGTSSWEPINTSGYKINELTFGDFNGDGKTDIIREVSF